MIFNASPDRIFKQGDVVNTPAGVRIVVSTDGHAKIGEVWVPMYYCAPMNKNGEPDQRVVNSRWRKISNSFLETQMKKHD